MAYVEYGKEFVSTILITVSFVLGTHSNTYLLLKKDRFTENCQHVWDIGLTVSL